MWSGAIFIYKHGFSSKNSLQIFSRISQQPLIFDVLQEREEAYQRELEIARVEKEKEIARLRAQQERAKDKQAEKVTGKYLHPLPWFHSSFVFIFSAWEKLSGLGCSKAG